MVKNELIKVVRIYDPAFAASVPFEAMRTYASTREMSDLPQLPAGAPSPVVFHFRRLTRTQLAHVERGDTEEERFSRAFLCGVVKVTGGRFGDGGWKPENADDARRVHMTEDERDAQGFAPLDEEEIGKVIYLRSKFPFDCSPHYLVPRLSLVAWDGNARRYAAQSPQRARQSSEPPAGTQG